MLRIWKGRTRNSNFSMGAGGRRLGPAPFLDIDFAQESLARPSAHEDYRCALSGSFHRNRDYGDRDFVLVRSDVTAGVDAPHNFCEMKASVCCMRQSKKFIVATLTLGSFGLRSRRSGAGDSDLARRRPGNFDLGP